MAYIRLMVLVLAFEVLITTLIGFGLYAGFSVFPYTQPVVMTTDAAVQTSGFNATLPMYMPTLSDLKIPYSLLQPGMQKFGMTGFLVSAALLVLQSFVRGMYLGGMKGWNQSRLQVNLIGCGRRYFKDMLAWSVFQVVTGALALIMTAAFFPLGLVIFVFILFFSLAPYLIVLQDLRFGEALAKAPRLLRRHFWTLIPYALFAMLCTLIISMFRSLASPFGYAVPLFLYVVVGTLLIAGLMRILAVKLLADRAKVPSLPIGETGTGWIAAGLSILLMPILVIAGVFAATGQQLRLLDIGGKEAFSGISYNSNFSDVIYASEMQYTSYEWQYGDFHISMRLPDLSGGRKPDELRGIADITWQVQEEVRTVNGSVTNIGLEPFTRKSRLMYRLVKQSAQDGGVYYSSEDGSASILPGGERPREPLSVQLVVSGDGSNIFVLQYASNLDVSQIQHVSEDGRFFIPGTSRVNPMFIRAYWFSAEQRQEDVFDLLAAKNKNNYMPTLNRAYIPLAVAMQEGDGRMVVDMLATMRRSDVKVEAPDWDEQTWTDYLRNRYKGADLPRTLEYATKAGMQGSYEGRELPDSNDGKTGAYEFDVVFPDGALPVTYEESKEDGRLITVKVDTATAGSP